jgi:hypothetical protein
VGTAWDSLGWAKRAKASICLVCIDLEVAESGIENSVTKGQACGDGREERPKRALPCGERGRDGMLCGGANQHGEVGKRAGRGG